MRRMVASMTAGTVDAGHVLVREDGPTATITLNRPDKRNALSLEVMEELIAVLGRLGAEQRARAIVIEGAGPAFSAGHDLSEMVGRDAAFYQRLFETCTELMQAIHGVPQPVIARVHGIATAAGCQLVAACDLAIAGDDARAYALTKTVMSMNSLAADAQEGICAFLEKRAPEWRGA